MLFVTQDKLTCFWSLQSGTRVQAGEGTEEGGKVGCCKKARGVDPDLRVINATLGFRWIFAGQGLLHSERTLPEHVLLFFFLILFSPMACLKACTPRGNVLFS